MNIIEAAKTGKWFRRPYRFELPWPFWGTLWIDLYEPLLDRNIGEWMRVIRVELGLGKPLQVRRTFRFDLIKTWPAPAKLGFVEGEK